jgi:hypothetical protein
MATVMCITVPHGTTWARFKDHKAKQDHKASLVTLDLREPQDLRVQLDPQASLVQLGPLAPLAQLVTLDLRAIVETLVPQA